MIQVKGHSQNDTKCLTMQISKIRNAAHVHAHMAQSRLYISPSQCE